MKVAFITRSTLYKVPGGDTVQIEQTAAHLQKLGVKVEILFANANINYSAYDLLHFFNITRPADILSHSEKTTVPYVVSTILVDYSEYDRLHRKGLSGFVLRQFSASANEYIKTLSRWLMRKANLQSKQYIWKGQQKSIQQILNKASWLLPNSTGEAITIKNMYGIEKQFTVIPNGINTSILQPEIKKERDHQLIICAARIEGLKNQLNLIKAVNNTEFELVLIGNPAPNQLAYYNECKKVAAENITFISHIPQQELAIYYKTAKVHVLPSWFETCGLSSLEAAACGCTIVVTDKGYPGDYFGDDAFYCDPADTDSIFTAIKKAAAAPTNELLAKKIQQQYTWQQSAENTLAVYKHVL